MATRQVFVEQTEESNMMLAQPCLSSNAAYGFVNTKAKWQQQSDQFFFELDPRSLDGLLIWLKTI